MNRREMLAGMAAAGALASVNLSYGNEAEVQETSPPLEGASSGASRVMALLVDSLDYRLVHRYLDSMPNARRIMSEGYAAQVLPSTSTWGNINFANVMTGAPPGTHYRDEKLPGFPDEEATPDCGAETLWQALGSEGRKSVLIDFSQTYPPGTDKAGVVAPPRSGEGIRATVFGPAVHQTVNNKTGVYDLSQFDRSGWPPGRGPTANRDVSWSPVPVSRNGRLESELTLTEGVTWTAVPASGSGGRHDQIRLYRPGEQTAAAIASVGEWTEWLDGSADGRPFKVRFHLLEISPDGSSFALLRSAAAPMSAFAEPQELESMLLSRLGPYARGTAIEPRPDDPGHRVAMAEMVESGEWVIRAAEIVMKEWGADLFFHKNYIVDNANHQCAAMIDPTYHRYDPDQAEPFDRVLRQAYADLDTLIGRMLEAAGNIGNTHVVVVGDHGICVNNVVCDINRRFRDVGLLTMRRDGSIDMRRTRAYTKETRQGNEVYVNLKGREAGGIVDESDYGAVQEEVIDTLLDWRGPDGKRAVCFAVKKREASMFGYWGRECGDVIFAYNQGFTWGVNPGRETVAMSTAMTTNHGAGVQTQDTGVTSNMAMLLAWGPKVVAGIERDPETLGPVPIHHVGTTIAALLGCRAPRHASGGLIYELLA